MTNIAIICGSFHKTEIERMLDMARDLAMSSIRSISVL